MKASRHRSGKKKQKEVSSIMDFETACKKVRELPSCSEKDMEELYGLYKQATVGDNNRGRLYLSFALINLCT